MNDNNAIKLWAIHTEQEEEFLKQNIIAIGWGEMGDLSALHTEKEAFKEKYDAVYPEHGATGRTMAINALFRLIHEIESGDYIVCLHQPWVNLGVITGDYVHDGSVKGCEQQRAVKWMKRLPQTAFSKGALREISSSPTQLFAVKRFTGEFLAALGVSYVEPLQPILKHSVHSFHISDLPASDYQTALSDIKHMISHHLTGHLTEHDFIDLLNTLLRAMNKRTN